MGIKLITVKTKKQLKQFIDYPHELFKDDPNYVPELFIAQKDMLTKGNHPSHAHIDFQLFMVTENDRIIGRIAGIYNSNHNSFTGNKDGFFGFFDVENNYGAAKKLLNAAADYLSAYDVDKIIGPVNFSTNDPAGLLIEGFDKPPSIMMTYSKPYYQEILERYGYGERMDLLAYWFGTDYIPDRVKALADNIESRLKRNGVTIRSINLKDFKNEVNKIREIYNRAWDKNWGFVPMTDAEFDYVAKDMKLAMDKDFVLVAEKEGKVVGFTLTMPNLNEVLIDVKKGRLLPTGIFKLLFNRKKIKSLRIITLGVLEEYRTLGIEVCFYVRLARSAHEKGYIGGEASWILENNEMMNRGLKNIKGEIYKKYRLYEIDADI